MLATRLSSIFELMLDQAPWTNSETISYSTLERPDAISVIIFPNDCTNTFDLGRIGTVSWPLVLLSEFGNCDHIHVPPREPCKKHLAKTAGQTSGPIIPKLCRLIATVGRQNPMGTQ